MKNKFLFILMVLVFGVSANAAELLVNGDFESGATGQLGGTPIPNWGTWGNSGWHNNDAGAVIDTMGMKLWWDDSGMFQDYPATAGGTYDYSVQVMDFSGDTSAITWDFKIEAEFYDALNVQLLAVVLDSFDSSVELDDTWVPIGGSIIAPANTAYGRVVMRLHDWQAGIGGAIYFDNASVTPEPATLLLFGLGGLFLRKRKP